MEVVIIGGQCFVVVIIDNDLSRLRYHYSTLWPMTIVNSSMFTNPASPPRTPLFGNKRYLFELDPSFIYFPNRNVGRHEKLQVR